MVKRQSQAKKTSRSTKTKGDSLKKRILLGIGLLIIVLATVASMAAYAKHRSVADLNQQRYDRIVAIYNSLKLGDDYEVTSVNVFGDKRVYEWDSGRTQSSIMTYVYPATVSDTLADLNLKVTAAGFTYFDEPYPGTPISRQFHYKSEKGEYIRVTVSSKVYDDAFQNARIINEASIIDAVAGVDTNAAPSNVTIKVNLDDNNE